MSAILMSLLICSPENIMVSWAPAQNPQAEYVPFYGSGDSLYWFFPNYYDSNGIGWSNGGTMRWATRFLIDSGHIGMLREVGVYLFDSAELPGWVNVYAGTETSPFGTPLGTGYSWPAGPPGWKVYDCSSEEIYLAESTYLWIYAKQFHSYDSLPAGCDYGPFVPGGSWSTVTMDDTLHWVQNYQIYLPFNWSMYALVEPTDVAEHPERVDFYFSMDVPSVAHGQAVIKFVLKEPGDVSLKLYGSDGRLASVLLNGSVGPGQHNIHVRDLPSDVYFVDLTQGDRRIIKKMIWFR